MTARHVVVAVTSFVSWHKRFGSFVEGQEINGSNPAITASPIFWHPKDGGQAALDAARHAARQYDYEPPAPAPGRTVGKEGTLVRVHAGQRFDSASKRAKELVAAHPDAFAPAYEEDAA